MEKVHRETQQSKTLLIFQAPAVIQRTTARLLEPSALTEAHRDATFAVRKETVALAEKLNIPVLDAAVRSDARWFSSHDGIHYSLSTGQGFREAGYSVQWQGGVSHMNGMVLLNMLCTRE